VNALVKLILKLIVVGLVANAAWRLGSAHATYYKFKDAVQQAAQFSATKSEMELRQHVLDLAGQYDVPVTQEGFSVRRLENHTYVDGSYTQPVELLPGYEYPWVFTWKIDTFAVEPPRLDPSTVR
jgi:hypothetical protein